MFQGKKGPKQVVDTWRDMGQFLKLWIRLKSQIFGEKGSNFFAGFYMREEERERENDSIQAFFRQSSEFCRLEFVKPRIKVHRLDEGYAHVPKMRDFIKDGDFGK